MNYIRYNQSILIILSFIIFLPSVGFCQLLSSDKLSKGKKYLLIDGSISAIGFQYDQQPIGNRFGVGFKLGLSQFIPINSKLDSYIKVNYSQLGSKYFRVYPTGIIDTINVYNSLKIFQESTKLNYINLRLGLRKKVFNSTSMNLYAGINIFGSLLLGAHFKGHELSGQTTYTAKADASYRKINWGFEPELCAIIHLLDGKQIQIVFSCELGVPNIYTPILQPSQGTWLTEHTRSFNLSLGFPLSKTSNHFTP